MIPLVYRDLLRDAQARRLLSGLGVSALGDGMSMVSVAWLAVLISPAGNPGVFVGLAVASYSLPGACRVLVAPLGVGSLLAVDAASFAFLGIQAWRTRQGTAAAHLPRMSSGARDLPMTASLGGTS